jgi:hypothetical protein
VVLTMRVCLVLGFCLLAMSLPFGDRAHGQQKRYYTYHDCTGSWSCTGVVNGCTLSSGVVPACLPDDYQICDTQKKSGYLCSGKDATGGTCIVDYWGCQ